MKRCALLLVLTVLLAAVTSASAVGLIIVEDSSWWPGPHPPHPIPQPWPPGPYHPPHRPHLFAPLETSSVKVGTRITDQLAITSVDQEFNNPTSAMLEDTFVFPFPKGSHLDTFSLEIDGR